MKILHIHPSMAGGGIETMIVGLANTMAETEDVSICSIFKPTEKDICWGKLNNKVHKYSLHKTSPGFSLKEIFTIFFFLKKHRFDIVNIHGFFYYYAFTIFLLHKRINFFYTIHSDATQENSKWDKRILFFKIFCFKHKWIHPITISKTSKESFTNLYGTESQLIYNGIAKPQILPLDLCKQYRISQNTSIFIHAGRISTPKNQLVLCRVFKTIIDNGFDVVLLIAGSRQMEDIYASIEPYFCDRIQYIGERQDIPQLMSNCDAMCLPSIWEGLPITLLESLSVGCIPICSPVGGIPNVIKNGVNGILSQSSSEKDYLSAIMQFLSLSQVQKQELKKACIESFSKYNIRDTANKYIDHYRSTK